METVWFGLVIYRFLLFGLGEKLVVVVVMIMLVAFLSPIQTLQHKRSLLESIVVVKKTRFLLPRNVAVQKFLELLTTSFKLDVCLNNPFGPMKNDPKHHEEVDIPSTRNNHVLNGWFANINNHSQCKDLGTIIQVRHNHGHKWMAISSRVYLANFSRTVPFYTITLIKMARFLSWMMLPKSFSHGKMGENH